MIPKSYGCSECEKFEHEYWRLVQVLSDVQRLHSEAMAENQEIKEELERSFDRETDLCNALEALASAMQKLVESTGDARQSG